MAASLRIARLTLSGLAPVNATDQDSLFSRYPALRQIIRRHLPAITASLLAEPRIASDDSIVEWYSDLSGQPVRLSDLPLSRQRNIRHRLDDRLDSLSHLADQLDAHDPDLARSLRESLHYPGDDYVYVVGDQPVLTFWGHRLADHPPAALVNPAASAKVVDEIPAVSGLGAPVRLITRRRMGRWLFIAGGILLLLLVLCFWWCYAHKEPPPDPFADLRDRFEQAQGDCDKLKLFDRSLTFEQRRHTDLQTLRNELKTQLDACRPPPDPFADLRDRFEQAQGDCDKLKLFDRSLTFEQRHHTDLQTLRNELKTQLDACRPPPDPFADLRDRFEQAQGDCDELKLFDRSLTPEQRRHTNLQTLRNELKTQLDACRPPPDPFADLKKRFKQAQGDCDKLKLFDRSLTPEQRHHTDLQTLRNELKTQLDACRPPPDPFADLKKRFKQAQGDCDELKLFDRSLTPEQRRHKDLQILSNELKQALETCRQQKKQDEKKLDKAMEQCPGERPEELAPDLVIVFDASGSMNQSIAPDSVSERLLRQAMQNSDDTTKAIMGVLGSVLSGTRVGQTINQAQMPKRITAAREATRRLVRTLPQDVDTGLVVLKDCPKATNMGFYKPNERQRLLMRVRSLQPERGTPLGDGILQAAKMVDGVNKPAVLIVVSDGKESCHADVCGIARRLAQQKPLLVINTVDITGTNAGDCLSSATGGRVYTANNAQEINEMIQKAAIEVTGPAHCRNAIPSP